MNDHPQTLTIREEDKARLRILFLAKHALSRGIPSAEDGTHAVYHHELLATMRQIGLNVTAADGYEALCGDVEADFVVTLLNRGGFLNSEMLAPLLATRQNVPFLGASPIIRGLGDDKHLAKRVAAARGVPVARWTILRRGGLPLDPPFAAERYVVKPNASSASWGVSFADGWQQALSNAEQLLASGHDALIEEWLPLNDVAVPVIGGCGGMPQLLPAMLWRAENALSFRSYEQKRGLAAVDQTEDLTPLGCRISAELAADMVRAMLGEFWPFDYGRFEFRYDPRSRALAFMEVNLSCNLWSRKTISLSARHAGIGHAELIETIIAHSLERNGVMVPEGSKVAA